jgi:anti-sigma B factor antagonist
VRSPTHTPGDVVDDELSVDRELLLEVERQGPAATVSVRGELDAATAPDLADLCQTVHADGARDLVIDLTETSFLDSSGLRALIEAHQLFSAGGNLALAHASEPVRRLLEITGLDDYFTLDTAG